MCGRSAVKHDCRVLGVCVCGETYGVRLASCADRFLQGHCDGITYRKRSAKVKIPQSLTRRTPAMRGANVVHVTGRSAVRRSACVSL